MWSVRYTYWSAPVWHKSMFPTSISWGTSQIFWIVRLYQEKKIRNSSRPHVWISCITVIYYETLSWNFVLSHPPANHTSLCTSSSTRTTSTFWCWFCHSPTCKIYPTVHNTMTTCFLTNFFLVCYFSTGFTNFYMVPYWNLQFYLTTHYEPQRQKTFFRSFVYVVVVSFTHFPLLFLLSCHPFPLLTEGERSIIFATVSIFIAHQTSIYNPLI